MTGQCSYLKQLAGTLRQHCQGTSTLFHNSARRPTRCNRKPSKKRTCSRGLAPQNVMNKDFIYGAEGRLQPIIYLDDMD